MESMYLRSVDFHVARDEDEIDELKQLQRTEIRKSQIKRFVIVFVLVAIAVIFQLLARISMPHLFGRTKPISRLFTIAIIVLIIFWVLSWLELMFQHKVIFDIESARIAKVVVKKKYVVQHYGLFIDNYRYIMCESNGAFIVEPINVRGRITYSNIKEGQTVYVQKVKDEGHYQYYFEA